MYKIGVIGDRESVLGFMSVGFSTVITDTPEEAANALKEMADNGFAIVYVIEDTALAIQETIALYKDSPLPAIIPVPGKNGSAGLGLKWLKSSVERAVGADILFKDQ